ncbi:HAD family hydrolase [Celeribacter indicus]|uniref:phosphoglycolate phosphatase n=1 Tax=Celeribacter indicus TaxID=1208324 RepID=A0A0B5E5R6_9RHOB|nr:HAD family hydrolase [Celeribacter indicus]AJE48730.1 haloacid dehalogenase domain-containing protein hydrolase [Celeribacter indicus]SDX11917.1 Phosphoglycolate phosphatase, HAD superfamily [Celeribacter indicus]
MTVLVVFDVDGTLLDTAGLHHDLATRVLAGDGLDVTFQPWGAYRHYTDFGVLDELYRHMRGRGITAEELARYDRLYEAALRDHLALRAIGEIAGARALLADLAAMEGVAVAFATGSLRRMAAVKLSLLGLDVEGLALATGGEHLTREAMVEDAMAQAMGNETPERVVILGDGKWDQVTAERLGLAFVALETGAHVFGPGPVHTITDFMALDGQGLVALAAPRVLTGASA